MGRPVEHDEATGFALVDVAEQILADEGPEAVTVRRVATAAGVTTRAVYTVFGNKDGLLAELAAGGHRILEKNLVGVPLTDDVAEDLLNLGYQAFRDFAVGKPHLYRLAFERTPILVAGHPSVIRASKGGVKVLITHMKRGQQAGVLRPGDPMKLALMYHAMTLGLVNWELAHAPPPVGVGLGGLLPPEATEGMWREGLSALIRGLASPL